MLGLLSTMSTLFEPFVKPENATLSARAAVAQKRVQAMTIGAIGAIRKRVMRTPEQDEIVAPTAANSSMARP